MSPLTMGLLAAVALLIWFIVDQLCWMRRSDRALDKLQAEGVLTINDVRAIKGLHKNTAPPYEHHGNAPHLWTVDDAGQVNCAYCSIKHAHTIGFYACPGRKPIYYSKCDDGMRRVIEQSDVMIHWGNPAVKEAHRRYEFVRFYGICYECYGDTSTVQCRQCYP